MEEINIIRAIIDSGNTLGIRYSIGAKGYIVDGTHRTYAKIEDALVARLKVLLQNEKTQIAEVRPE